MVSNIFPSFTTLQRTTSFADLLQRAGQVRLRLAEALLRARDEAEEVAGRVIPLDVARGFPASRSNRGAGEEARATRGNHRSIKADRDPSLQAAW